MFGRRTASLQLSQRAFRWAATHNPDPTCSAADLHLVPPTHARPYAPPICRSTPLSHVYHLHHIPRCLAAAFDAAHLHKHFPAPSTHYTAHHSIERPLACCVAPVAVEVHAALVVGVGAHEAQELLATDPPQGAETQLLWRHKDEVQPPRLALLRFVHAEQVVEPAGQ